MAFEAYKQKSNRSSRTSRRLVWRSPNEILKNDLSIRFFENPNDSSLDCGRFVFEDILILPDDVPFEFDNESSTWRCCCEEDDEIREILSLDEYIENEIETANELIGHVICKDAVVLIDGSCIEDLEKAKAERRFLVYENNREEVVKQFCETRCDVKKGGVR